MFHRFRFPRSLTIAAVLFLAPFSSTSSASPTSYGTGVDTAEVVFDWPDGFIADYQVRFGSNASSTIDVYDATQLTGDDPNLTLNWSNFPYAGIDPNYFLNLASYTGGHIGDGSTYDPVNAPNNFWTEWFDNGSGWAYGNGASVDTVGNGGRIGWVFAGQDTPVVPEPATASILLIGAAILLKRRSLRPAALALGVIAVSGTCLLSSNVRAADSASVVPGTLVQGSVKTSLGVGTTYDVETNNLGDWPLNTGASGGA